MTQTINIATKQSGDTLTAGELNTIVDKANAAINEQNETKQIHAQSIAANTQKLAGIAENANNYQHPASHPASMITETEGLKIMTAAERLKLAGLNEFNKGFFANEASIIAPYPVGQSGWFVINGETDTVWVWDDEGMAWKNTGNSSSSVAGIINILYADLLTAIANSTLVPGTSYLITDRGDRGLLFQAVKPNELAPDGVRFMLCPAIYLSIGNWIGVWNNKKGVLIDSLTIWNGLVWKCIVEVAMPLDAPNFNAVNWVLVPKDSFENGEYVEMVFGCSYDVTNDWISKQWDNFGNVFGISKSDAAYSWLNFCDRADWNFRTSEFDMFDNICDGIYNNTTRGNIYRNKIGGAIEKNSNEGEISHNTCRGSISGNSNIGNIYQNANMGDITGNEISGSVAGNENTGNITSNLGSGSIASNTNSGNIVSNNCGGGIYNNSNKGGISTNTISASISENSNVGEISGNATILQIVQNANNGSISENTIVGEITNNVNNGDIRSNSSANTPCSIRYNNNNGDIMNYQWDADLVGAVTNLGD